MMAATTAFADDDDDDDDDGPSAYEAFQNEVRAKSLNRASVQIRLEPLGYGLMGDNVDGYSGRLKFTTTDVSIPGNSELPVKITRTASGGDASYMQKFYMADWDIEVPHISQDRGSSYYLSDGDKLNIPGLGPQEMFEDGIAPDEELSTTIFEEPRWGGVDISRVTVDHTVKLRNGGWVTPDGTEYILGKTVWRSAGDKYLPSDYTPQNIGGRTVTRNVQVQLATEVRDKLGNWVKYEYTGDSLTRIHSNDGREITLTYFSADGTQYVSSVTANERTWTYQYKTVSDIDRGSSSTRKLLHRVIQPDGKYWEYDIDRLVQGEPSYSNRRGKFTSDPTIRVKHPYGAEATYELGEVVLADTDRKDPYNSLRIIGTLWHKSKAVYSKTLHTTGGETLTWTRDYEHFNYESEFTHVKGNGVGNGHSRILTKPDGTRVESQHGQDQGFLRSETYAPGSTAVLKRIDHTYTSTVRPFGRFNGYDMPDEEEYDESYKELLTKRVVTQNGDIHTTEHNYDIDPWSSTYSYHKPIETTVYTNVTGSTIPRVTEREYKHLTNKWILNLLEKAVINSREIASFDYDTYGRLNAEYRYNQPNATYGYYPVDGTADSGLLSWVEDALSRRTEAHIWKRGVPQRIKRADNTNDYRYVNDNGWPTRDKDARGGEVLYEYDSMGRVTLIDAPGNWDSTVIDYDFTVDGAVQEITKGQSRETITYDNLFRVTLESKQDISTGWFSHKNTSYNSRGLVSFSSQASTNSAEAKGKDFTYDGLGRIVQERENVAPYARIRHLYYTGLRHRIYDPSGAFTQYYSYGYNGVDSKNYRAIFKYGDGGWQQYTYIDKDAFGQMYRLRQSGSHNGHSVNQSQLFYYNAEQRLCRHYVPEHGATKYQYDAAGQVVAYAKAQNNSGCAVPTNNARVSMNYDNEGRVLHTNFTHSGTPDVTFTYDANGNTLTSTRGVGSSAVTWSYDYNELNMVESENLAIDGMVYGIDYDFNAGGFVTQKTFPSGQVINYTPDAFGRHKEVRKGSTTLMSNASYHPSGALAGMTYGNNQVFSQTLNSRLLPLRVRSYKGGQKAIDQQFTYDARGKITAILDRAVTTNSRNYSYDKLGQLVSASGPWGQGSYEYDSLGNLRNKTLGSRTVNLSYDTRNRVSESVDTGPRGTRALLYDARGNVRKLGALNFVYDYSDQPVTISGTASGTYKYDGNFKRVKSVVNGKTLYNVYDRGGKLVHVNAVNDNKITDYVRGSKGTLARITNNVVTYLHPDHLNSAQSGTNSSGNVIWREQYTPFGEDLQSPAANDNLAGFSGHIKDKATGLSYMQARYYDPTIGRFLSVDPKGFLDTGRVSMFNRYAYSSNDPINRADPDGKIDIYIGGAGDGKSGIVSSYVDGKTSSPGRTVAYFEQGNVSDVVEAAKKASKKGEPVNIIAHSWGSTDAAKASRQLGKAGVKVNTLVGVDPVNKPLRNGGLKGADVGTVVTVNSKGKGNGNGVEALGKAVGGGKPKAFESGNATVTITADVSHADFEGGYEQKGEGEDPKSAEDYVDESYEENDELNESTPGIQD